MKDEKQTIEEMARIICKSTSNKGNCDKCGFKKQCSKFDDATDLYNAGYRKQSEWISVEDRLPEEKVMVLGYVFTNFDNGDTSDGIYVMELRNGLFYPFNCSAIKGNSKVTHWMPLPEAPKGGAQK